MRRQILNQAETKIFCNHTDVTGHDKMDINDICNIKSSTPNKYWKGTVANVNTDSKNMRYVSVIYTVGHEATRTTMLPEAEFVFKDDEYWQK